MPIKVKMNISTATETNEDTLMSIIKTELSETNDEFSLEEFLKTSGLKLEPNVCIEEIFEVGCNKENNIGEEETNKKYVCMFCGQYYKYFYMLKNHVVVHSDSRDYICSICKKAFRQQTTLNQHMSVHSQERKFKCETCSKRFSRISTLISHRKTHGEIKPFQCELCPKSFHQKGNLKNHIFIHTNERPYTCGYCNCGFNQKSNLTCHIRRKHGSDMNNALLKCSYCPLKFSRQYLVRAHELKMHSVTSHGNQYIVPLITNSAMNVAKEKGEIPFGVLHLLKGTPIVVRIIEHGDGKFHLLRPAENNDFIAAQSQQKNQKYVSIAVVATIRQIQTKNGFTDFVVSMPQKQEFFTSSSDTYLPQIPDLNRSLNQINQPGTSRNLLNSNDEYSAPSPNLNSEESEIYNENLMIVRFLNEYSTFLTDDLENQLLS